MITKVAVTNIKTMKLLEPLEIPLLYNTEETKLLGRIGQEDIPDEKYDIHNATFYTIDSINPLLDNDDNCIKTRIVSGGFDYETPILYKELKQLIDKAMI